MQTDTLKTVLAYGITATSKMTDGMMELLPEESRQKAKHIEKSMLKIVHEIIGDILNDEQNGEEADKQKQTKITIE